MNTMVDLDLQKLFQASGGVHGKSIADALEIGIREILKDIDPVAILELEIKLTSERLASQQSLRAEMRVLEPAQKRLKQFEMSANALEASRLAAWEKDKLNITRDIRRGDVNWNRILWDYQFPSRKEAIAWFRAHMPPAAITAPEVKKS